MQTKCSCLDWSNPCKHIAAVYLLLAAEFDRDPFLIFKLRGLLMNDLFAMLEPGNLEQIDQTSKATSGSGELSAGSVTAQNDSFNNPNSQKLFDIKNFWKSSVDAKDIVAEWLPAAEIAMLPNSLGDFPFWRGQSEFLSAIIPAYKSAPAQTERLFCTPAASTEKSR
jgi:uncharacterized Zn finger protein